MLTGVLGGSKIPLVGAGGDAQLRDWTTRRFQCDGTKIEEWLLACFCLPCAAAAAKSRVDGANPVYNLLCWTPISAYSFVRLAYNIKGECGEDCMAGIFCPSCNVRQMVTETAQVGALPSAGQAASPWNTTLFSCGCMELCYASICPFCVAHNVRQMMQPRADQWFDYFCLVPTAMYGQVRVHYGLDSECQSCPCVEDVAVSTFCFPCALARAQREGAYQKTKAVVGGGAANILGAAARKYGGLI